MLAALVGRCVDALGSRLGSGATGVVQSALGNLPELLVGVFALRAGLVTVVQAAIIGSVLANAVLVLGLAFLAGGLRHGPQRFDSQQARLTAVQLLLAVAALAVPSLARSLDTPAAAHVGTVSTVTAVVLLLVFLLALPASLRHSGPSGASPGGAALLDAASTPAPRGFARSTGTAVAGLLATSLAAAAVSDWFVAALTPALQATHVSQAFAGLVVVAIAGNAVENLVGVRLMWRGRPDYAVSVILQSPLQIALVLAPALVLLSHVLGGAVLTLALPPLLLAAVTLGVVVAVFVVADGESTWLEGAALVGLYVIIASAFWWG